jgi:ribonuclease E
MVQVIKDEVGHKGATLSTNISLPGRFLVFMPDSERGGVSRKIEDEEQRARLKHLLKGLGSEDASAIIRTAGVDRSLSELKRDFMNLRRIWNQIKQKFEEFEKPGLIYQEEEATTRMIRDYFTEDVGQVIIDDANAFQRTLEFFQANMPSQQNRLQLYLGEKTLFASYGIEAQVECLYRNQVPLPSGGSLVIVPTEALVAIDVNSGRSTKGKNIEETALGTNLEAAEEAARQLRLRNLGGLIVIDFIDMDLVKNRRAVEEKLADALKTDKARCTLGEISQFGLLELSRQRIAGSISRNSPELTMANLILRKIQDLAFEQKVSEIFMKLPIKLATHLLNVKRRQLSQLEMDYELRVEIKPDPTLELEELPEMEVVHKTTHGEMRSSIPIHAAELYEEGKNKSSRKRGRKKKQTEEESVTENQDSEVSAIKQDTGEIPTEDSKEITHEKEKLTLTDEPPQSDLNQVEEIESNSEVSSDAASPESKPQEKEEISAGLLFSSVHENNEKLEDQEWSPPTVSEWRLKLQQAPDHSTIYSSSHESLNPEGLAENQSETNEDSNKTSEIQKPSLIQESSETSESSEGSQTDALVSSKPKKKPASRGRSRNKSNQTGKSDQNEEKVEEKQDSSSKTPAKKTASRSRSKTLKSKKAIDTSELNEKAEKAFIKKSDADSSSESGKDSKKEEVLSATPKAPEKKRTRKKPSSKTPEKAAEQSGGDDVSSATTKKPPRSRSRKKKSPSAEGADET